MRALKRFLTNKSGATAIEYSLIGAVISIALIAGGRSIGTAMNDLFYQKALNGFN